MSGWTVGGQVPALRKRLTREMVHAFEECAADMIDREREETIHTDERLAAEVGFRGPPVASGMVSVAFANELLRRAFGEPWLRAGHLALAFLAPMGSERDYDLGAEVVAVDAVADGLRVGMRVWCRSADGVTVSAGTADVVVPGGPS